MACKKTVHTVVSTKENSTVWEAGGRDRTLF